MRLPMELLGGPPDLLGGLVPLKVPECLRPVAVPHAEMWPPQQTQQQSLHGDAFQAPTSTPWQPPLGLGAALSPAQQAPWPPQQQQNGFGLEPPVGSPRTGPGMGSQSAAGPVLQCGGAASARGGPCSIQPESLHGGFGDAAPSASDGGASHLGVGVAGASRACPGSCGAGHMAGEMPAQPAVQHRVLVSAASGPDRGVGGMVPVEYANARLWGITSEYENLLNIQKDQHVAAIRQRDAEVANLRRLVEDLQAGHGRFGEDGVSARLRAKDDECALALEATRKELALFAGLLQTRDRQIADLQAMCEAKQAFRLAGCVNGTPAFPSGEAETLRKEKAELERLLVAKDKQMSALQAVDPGMADTSALQLGAQAIQMFHDSMRMRAEADKSSQENKELRDKIDRLQAHGEQLEAQLAEKRGEVKELTTTLGAKVQRVLELEAEIESMSREQHKLAKEAGARLDRLQDEVSQLREDSRTKQQFAEHLKEQLEDRDQRLLRQQVECAEYKSNANNLEQRVGELETDLTSTERQLEDLLRSTAHKDQLVRDMTQQISNAETKLHAFQINELMTARRRRWEQQEQRDEHIGVGNVGSPVPFASREWIEPMVHSPSRSLPSGTKDQELSPIAKTSRHASRRGGSAGIGSGRGHHGSGCFPVGNSMCSTTAGVGGGTYAGSTMLLDTTMGSAGGGALDASAFAMSGHPDPAKARATGSRVQLSCGSALAPPPHCSHQIRNEQHACSSAVSTPKITPGSVASAAAPVSTASSACGPFAQSYRPQPGDSVDQKLAAFVNRPENSVCQALFCRLGDGAYLFGTRRTCLRLQPGTGCLEALHGSEWLRVEEFVRRMDVSQGINMQRAREVSGGTAALIVGPS